MKHPATAPAIIPIHPQAGSAPAPAAPSSPGCGPCQHSTAGPVCWVERTLPPGQVRWNGPADQVAQVLAALRRDLDGLAAPAPGAPAWPVEALIHRLNLGADEAELVLAVAPHCGGAQLAQTAFHTLRRLLPDTDIYVTHAR